MRVEGSGFVKAFVEGSRVGVLGQGRVMLVFEGLGLRGKGSTPACSRELPARATLALLPGDRPGEDEARLAPPESGPRACHGRGGSV